MKIWPVQDAKARFSELLEDCVTTGPQLVSKRGTVTAVLVPIAEWERLTAEKPRTLKEWLTADDHYRGELNIPPRSKRPRRPAIKF
jgi:prevent-host-death family protein